MANDSLPQRVSRAPRSLKHSLKHAFTGKSQPADPSNVVALRGPGQGLPNSVNGKVPPRRIPNKQRRTREYLTEREVDQLIDAARKAGRYGHRDATLILLAYRHGLRVSELVALRWDQIDLSQGLLHVARVKHGTPSTHPLRRTGDSCVAATEARLCRTLRLYDRAPRTAHNLDGPQDCGAIG